jgi:tetratricopeptide (TPR) repeat protein
MKKLGLKLAGVLGIVFLLIMIFPVFGRAAGGDLEQGMAQYQKENYEEALSFLNKARQADPKSSIAAFYLGLTYKQIGNYREAATNYRDAATLAPPVKEAYVELIEMLYNLNEFREAKQWADKADALGIKPAHVAFLRGLIMLKQGDNKDAIDAFTKAKGLDMGLQQAADFQIAMAYANDRRLSNALKSLKAVIAVNPNSELGSFAKEYETALAKSLAEYRKWRFSVGVGDQYDTNIISKPSSSIGPGIDDLPGKSGFSIFNTARIDYSPLFEGSWFYTAQYNFYTNNYFGVYAYKYDLLSQTLTLTPGCNFKGGAFTAPVSYNYVWLNEHRYMEMMSVKPTVSIATAGGMIWQLGAGYAKRGMVKPSADPDEERDGDIYNFTAGYVYPIKEGKGMFNLKYEYSIDDAKGINWDNRGSRVSMGLLLPLEDKVNLMLNGDAYVQKYGNVNSFTGTSHGPGFPDEPSKRLDKTYTASGGILWEVTKVLNMNLNYTFTRAHSNFAVYDYSRNQFSLGLEYSF